MLIHVDVPSDQYMCRVLFLMRAFKYRYSKARCENSEFQNMFIARLEDSTQHLLAGKQYTPS